jgi:rod shape-determining protein MreB and related proteins
MKGITSRSPRPRFLDRLRTGVAVDIGTAWTRMHSPATGLVQEPTIQAITRTGQVAAWGSASLVRLTRDGSSVTLERPVQAGVVANYAAFQFILRELLEQARSGRGFLRPRILIGLSPVTTKVEMAALQEACRQAAGPEIRLVLSTRAAAAGSGMPIHEVSGRMVVEAGAGCCSATVFSGGREVTTRSARVGSQAIDMALEDYLRREHQIWIGSESIRVAKERYGTTREPGAEECFGLRGMDLLTNLPRTVQVERHMLRATALPTVGRVLQLVEATMAATPPELAGDLLQNGIVLTGGMARLDGLAEDLSSFTGCPVSVPEEPELATLRGLSCLAADADACATLPGEVVRA